MPSCIHLSMIGDDPWNSELHLLCYQQQFSTVPLAFCCSHRKGEVSSIFGVCQAETSACCLLYHRRQLGLHMSLICLDNSCVMVFTYSYIMAKKVHLYYSLFKHWSSHTYICSSKVHAQISTVVQLYPFKNVLLARQMLFVINTSSRQFKMTAQGGMPL